MPYKDPEARKAYRKDYYQAHQEWEISRVKDWKRNNKARARKAEKLRKRRERARKRARAKALALVAKATELATAALAERAAKEAQAKAQGFTGKINPGRI